MRARGGRAGAFDQWIRGPFVDMNTALEELYFAQSDRADVRGVGQELKARIRDEGRDFIVALLNEGNTDEGFENAFGVLGNVGMYLGAMRRHELTNPATEERSPFPEASSLALHVGASIGMAPRFATAHLATHNFAVNGARKSFTWLRDERLFIDENTRSILSFERAASALVRVVPLGVSSPVIDVLLNDAKTALEQAVEVNERLFTTLDVDRFFYSVRPYYKPYRVGRTEFRGANAGDFAGINEIDLLLGLCRANDPYYAQLLVDKMLFMLPRDQARLRDVMTRVSLLDEFLALPEAAWDTEWFQKNARTFLEILDLFGRTATQHHDSLVARFITHPSENMSTEHLAGITASGPPLPVLLKALETLRDLRTAAPRTDLKTRHEDVERLRSLVRYG